MNAVTNINNSCFVLLMLLLGLTVRVNSYDGTTVISDSYHQSQSPSHKAAADESTEIEVSLPPDIKHYGMSAVVYALLCFHHTTRTLRSSAMPYFTRAVIATIPGQ